MGWRRALSRLLARLRAVPFALIGLGLMGPVAWIGYRDAAATEALYHLFFSRAVAQKCGAMTHPAEQGFEVHRDRLVRGADLPPATVRALRLAGGVAEDREWLNRGLGGYRMWCAEEGRAAASRLSTP
ncbi:MAG: hypothetical protein AAF637_01120 [Pseudomonadota bacterium]